MSSTATLPGLTESMTRDFPFRFGDRERTYLTLPARVKFVTLAHFIEIDGGSPNTTPRRVKNVVEAGLLRSVRPSAFEPRYLTLSNAGANFLIAEGLFDPRRLTWVAKAYKPSAQLLNHTLQTTSNFIAFARACKTPGTPVLIDHFEVIPKLPEKMRDHEFPFRMSAAIKWRGKLITKSVTPDRVMLIAHPSMKTTAIALETDTGFVPIARKDVDGTSNLRKWLVYLVAISKGAHRAWGADRVRVCFVTTTRARIDNMVAELKKATGGKGSELFLFIEHRKLIATDALSAIWTDGTGASVRLLDGHAASLPFVRVPRQ